MEICLDLPGLSLQLCILHWNLQGVWEILHNYFSIGVEGKKPRLVLYLALDWLVFDGPFLDGALSLRLGFNGRNIDFGGASHGEE